MTTEQSNVGHLVGLLSLILWLAATPAAAQNAAASAAMIDEPCPAPLLPTPALQAVLNDLFFESRTLTATDFQRLESHPDLVALNAARRQAGPGDWAGLCRYQAANRSVRTPTDIVFIGDSITENWAAADPEMFSDGVVGRGISAQVSAQMLVRFMADVVALEPAAVHILAGTNDVAGNAGPMRPEDFRNNIRAMVAIAQANDIDVIIGSIPPAAAFSWRPDLKPASRIVELNDWLRDYARRVGAQYVDYHAALGGPDGELRSEFGNDGVHPNRRGYAIMRRLVADRLPGR